ncbi:MAG: AAA family ATPase [Acidobacteriota bacterium]|nr:AAA family ATPase [Acidobacteriota bacterium]
MTKNLIVAIASDFFDAFSRLPKTIQGKASRRITQFRKNPTASGLNYEKIRNAHPHMRSIRIDGKYRAIVLHPAEGNVYLLLWVDNHDEAYQWARRHKCSINPESGAIQVYQVQKTPPPVFEPPSVVTPAAEPEAPPAEAMPAPFAHMPAEQLMRLGVPPELVDMVRRIRTEEDLDRCHRQLPADAYECLFLSLCGAGIEEILAERDQSPHERVDPEDFEEALKRPVTGARFAVFDKDETLVNLMLTPLSTWRVYLHPTQKKYVTGHKSGSMRVLGGAGTGKTVVAMHRAKWLAEHVANGQRKVLFTTFTRNLAVDISSNLSSICSEELMKRIEVVNLDSWVARYLRKIKDPADILYDPQLRDQLWERALVRKRIDLPDNFFREEWDRVVQPNSIDTLESYKRVSRVGRGTRLDRRQRIAVWQVLDEYRLQLMMQRKKEPDDAYRDAAAHLIGRGEHPYAAVVVDEAQDMGTQAFRLLRALVEEGPDDLFIVGDAHQRIYGRNRVVLGRCGIRVVGRAHKLRLNYRTTDEIRREAVRLLEGRPVDDLDNGTDDNKAYKSLFHGTPPDFFHYRDQAAQNEAVIAFIQAREALPDGPEKVHPDKICIVARTHEELQVMARTLEQRGMPYVKLETGLHEDSKPGVRLATMHRVKGLEFQHVLVIGVNRGLVPLADAVQKADEQSAHEADTEERALVYVAMTRARAYTGLFSHGAPSPYFTWREAARCGTGNTD